MIESEIAAEQLESVVLLRDRIMAFGCKYLRRAIVVRPQQSLQISRPMVMEPHLVGPRPGNSPPHFMNMRIFQEIQPGGFLCTSKRNIEWAKSLVPPEVRPMVRAVETTADFCQTCPLWQADPES